VLLGFILVKDIKMPKASRGETPLSLPNSQKMKIFAENATFCCIFTSFEQIFNL